MFSKTREILAGNQAEEITASGFGQLFSFGFGPPAQNQITSRSLYRFAFSIVVAFPDRPV
jgi:hypothetical protein